MAAGKGLTKDTGHVYDGENLHCPLPAEPLRQPATGEAAEHGAGGGYRDDPTFCIGVFGSGEFVEPELGHERFHDHN